MININRLISDYALPNSIFERIARGDEFYFLDQSVLNNFFINYHNVNEIEEAILNLITTTGRENRKIIFSRLLDEAGKMSAIYSSAPEFFSQSLIDKVFEKSVSFYVRPMEIEAAMKESSEARAECNELKNSYESQCIQSGFTNTERRMYEREIERLESIEKEAKEKIDKLFQIKREKQVEYGKICVNRFQSLAKLSEGILTTLKKYMVDFDAAVSSSPVTTISTARLFPKVLISKLHKLCNDKQFEDISQTDLFAILNLQESADKLIIKHRETARMYYLIHSLENTLEEDSRVPWRQEILARLNIKESSYKAHYRDVVSDMPGQKNEEFAGAMNEIFKNL